MAKEQRTFTREFKVEAVRLAETSGKPIAELARELGVSDSTIHNWRQELAQHGKDAFPESRAPDAHRGGESPPQTGAGNREARTRYLKKSHNCLFKTSAMKYQFIAENASEYPVSRICQVLLVDESAYYKWRKRLPSAQQLQDEALAEQIEGIYQNNWQAYGSPRIHALAARARDSCGTQTRGSPDARTRHLCQKKTTTDCDNG